MQTKTIHPWAWAIPTKILKEAPESKRQREKTETLFEKALKVLEDENSSPEEIEKITEKIDKAIEDNK